MSEHLPLQKKRILGLDLMRAVAILMVVFHHGFSLFDFPFIPIPDGVDIFFVLSGFLIGGILIKTMEKQKGFSWSDLKIFWFRRWFRTLPAFWFTLLLNLTLYFILNLQNFSVKDTLKLMFLKEKLWQYFFFLQNLTSNMVSRFFPETWSLSVEEWFYLSLPIILFFALKSKLKSYKAILLSIIIIITIPTLARYFFSDIHLKWNWLSTRMVVIMRLDGIGLGVLMAYIKYYKPVFWDKLASFKILIYLGIFIFYASFYIIHENYYYFNSYTITNLTFYTFTSIGVMITIPPLSKMTSNDSVFDRAITFISLISYSMYLINGTFILTIIQQILPADISGFSKFSSCVAFWISTFIISYLMYKYIEQPFMKIRDKYFID
jgi:peptidoglycan/LPS O-acetylase OafA/YrhL